MNTIHPERFYAASGGSVTGPSPESNEATAGRRGHRPFMSAGLVRLLKRWMPGHPRASARPAVAPYHRSPSPGSEAGLDRWASRRSAPHPLATLTTVAGLVSHRLPALAIAGLLSFIAGCVSAPTPASSTAPWIPPKSAQDPDSVWKSVREQKRDFTAPMTLAELADLALQNSPATRKAWSDARAAAAQVDFAQGYFMPVITGTAGAMRQNTSANPSTFDQDYWKYGPGLQVNYLIFNFGGGRRAAVEQALQTVYAADFTFNRSIQDVLFAVETAYYGLVSAQAGVEAAEAGVKDAQATLNVAQERQTQGVGTALEVLQAQAGYDRSLYDQANARGLFQIARGGLALAVGVPADTALQVTPPTVEVPEAFPEPDLHHMIDAALARRPDVAALRAALAARRAAVKVSGSELWPSLYLSGGASRDYYDNIGGKAFQDDDWSYNANLNIQWPLFDGFQTRSARRAAIEQVRSAEAQLKQAELAASVDVWTRYRSYETALQKHQFSAALLKSTSASYDLAMDSYKGGLKSILDLLTAESLLAQARSQYVAARQDAFGSLAGLAYALGLLQKGGAEQAPGFLSTFTEKEHQP